MILMIDNYDSFTYNLVQFLGELGQELKVYRNDEISITEIRKAKPEYIVISPGPGRPENSGITEDVVRELYKEIPILGVCLGHQAIGQVLGAKIAYAPSIMHGKTSMIYHDNKTIFKDILNPFEATRYHSLILDKESIPDCFEITAWTKDNIVMGIRHKKYPVEGIQFHPESILTGEGKNILKNFLEMK